ncbi:cysteine desulfurase [Friedmanniella endophytica]|uniref:cysteine desulfurase n=1 Tax=Microlunatus kandeliicorticis TaxID=1759536 RepID=A0A7W3P6W9_9ACTN|nr:cysteine desulfurase family protein [Microlunatus kandeliicorticis]MBA8795496.1 cysteine desulfurase [Microlunatus kandeliicorticis]
MTRTYLDHAASTPMRPVAIEAVAVELSRTGNPSSLHGSGRAARKRVEECREQIAAAVGAHPTEVVFTSGGTESDNLAVLGGFAAARRRGRDVVVCAATEHHAVLDTVHRLGTAGATVEVVGVDAEGRPDPEALAALVDRYADRLGVVSVMAANNETGVCTDLDAVVAAGRRSPALLHSDAVQLVGQRPFSFADSGLDAVSLTGHKLGGPVGTGALLLRRDAAVDPIQFGGGQERELRSGTLDVAGIAGFAAAVDAAVAALATEQPRRAALRDRLVAGVLAAVPGSRLNGGGERLPGIANLEFAGADADAVLMLLDRAGIDCSTGSACSAGLAQPSHVLLAMGRDPRQARSALRFSLGHPSTEADVAALLAALPEAVERGRLASAA